jgi:hypothetical protein
MCAYDGEIETCISIIRVLLVVVKKREAGDISIVKKSNEQYTKGTY